ncbi:MAG: transposase [Acidobacteriota bacterium]
MDMLFSEPVAYFLTWTTYGTWLPGDRRGWVRKRHGFQLPNLPAEREAQGRMTETACRLNSRQRQVVEGVIRAHCQIRGWILHAVNCRSNHVHVVVTAKSVFPDAVMAQLKAWSTRKLKARSASEGNQKPRSASEGNQKPQSASEGKVTVREEFAAPSRQNWWTEGGSVRLLFREKNLQEAIRYVVERQ